MSWWAKLAGFLWKNRATIVAGAKAVKSAKDAKK